jgi:acyl-coenzyme A synthetase/AMP-(fatty) acid ligase
MNRLTRQIIGQTIVYIDRGQEYRYNDIIDLVNKWHAVFDQFGLSPGDRIAVFDTQSVEHVSLIIAGGERGLQYFALPKEVFVSSEEKFDYNNLNIKVVFVRPSNFKTYNPAEGFGGVGLEDRCYWKIRQFNMSTLHEYSPNSGIKFENKPNDVVLLSQTSGTTGRPKEFAHTHSSLMTASLLSAKLFYKNNDTVLLYTTFNHVGVISTQLVPAMIAGAKIIGHYDFSGESVMEKLFRYRPNKTIIFPSNLYQMMRLPQWENIKLDFLEEVICGGQLINKEFVTELFAKGVSKVHNIYGSSEALPPVLFSTVTTDNVESCYNSLNSVALGLPAGDWKVKIIDRVLCVYGPGLASADWISERFIDGYYSTGDRATFENNVYWTSGRADRMVRRHDVLVNASATERELESKPGIREAIYYITPEDQLIIGLKFSLHLSQIEQDKLVAHVRNTLRPDRIYKLKAKNNFESIKALSAFGDEL